MGGWASLGQPVACEDWYVQRKEPGESAVRRRSSGGDARDARDARGLRLPSDLSVWRATAAHPESEFGRGRVTQQDEPDSDSKPGTVRTVPFTIHPPSLSAS